MSSGLPLRKTARSARTNLENAHARSRVPPVKPSLAGPSGPATRATATTASSKAKSTDLVSERLAAPKRRIVLKDVTDNNRPTKATSAKEPFKKPLLKPAPVVAKPTRQAIVATTVRRHPPRENAPLARQPLALIPIADVPPSLTPPDVPKSFDFQSILDPALPLPPALNRSSSKRPAPEEVQEPPRSFKRQHTLEEEAARVQAQWAQEEEQAKWIQNEEARQEEARVAAQLARVDDSDADEMWDDIDAEDSFDPESCPEYAADIYKFLKEIECNAMPELEYMSGQVEITWRMRGQLINWLMYIHNKYRFLPESLFLCVNLFDRFLSIHHSIASSKLQLVGATCFLIATKFEETLSPSIKDIVSFCGDQYSREEVIKAESYILRSLEWDLSYAGPLTWLRRGSRADGLDAHVRTRAKYLLEVGILDRRLITTPPSLMAAASLWLARLTLDREDWHPTLRHYTMYKESDLLPVATKLLQRFTALKPDHTLYKKYASSKYGKLSIEMMSWARRWWKVGSVIDVETVLPAIKTEIAAFKAQEA